MKSIREDLYQKIPSVFMPIAAIGFVLSLIAHFNSLIQTELLGMKDPLFLHFGIFLVWLPAIIIVNKITDNQPIKQKNFWKLLLSGCPLWLRNLTYGVFIYAIMNFAYMIAMDRVDGSISSEPGSMSFDNIRVASGHWMLFYISAFSILFTAKERWNDLITIKKCINGHEVSPLAKFCEICGAPVNKEDN